MLCVHDWFCQNKCNLFRKRDCGYIDDKLHVTNQLVLQINLWLNEIMNCIKRLPDLDKTFYLTCFSALGKRSLNYED